MADRTRSDRTRRRFVRRRWARRWLTWRYLLGFVLVVGVVGFAVYAVYYSPWLRLEAGDVAGTSQLSEAEVLDAAQVPAGDALATVNLDSIAVRVRGLPTVESVVVTREWPDQVRIEVTERAPIAVVPTGDAFTQLDDEGYTFGTLKQAPDGLPQVVVGTSADRAALQEAAAVVAALDEEKLTGRVDHVEVNSVDDIRLVLSDERTVQWGSAEQSEQKAAVLLQLLADVPDARQFNVSVPDLPTSG